MAGIRDVLSYLRGQLDVGGFVQRYQYKSL